MCTTAVFLCFILLCYFFVKFLQKSLQKISAYVKITSNANDKKITIIAKHDL